MNESDIVRDYIANILNKNKYDAIDCGKEIEKLYNNLKKNRINQYIFYQVLYHTSYVCNYMPMKLYNDEYSKDIIKKLDSYKNIDDFIIDVDSLYFYELCQDVLFFSDLKKYQKINFLNHSKDRLLQISKISSYYEKDIELNSYKYSLNIVMDKYNENISNSNDKNVAVEDTICDVVDFLIDLEKEDNSNYINIFTNMMNTYHLYNTYLLDNNLKMDEYAMDIMNEEIDYYVLFAANNPDALEPVVRDYLTYKLLPVEEKEKIKKQSDIKTNDRVIININDKVRSYLKKVFNGLKVDDDSCVNKYKEELSSLKNSTYLDEFINVLYISMYNYYHNMYNSYNDKDTKDDVDFIEEFNSIEEFKEYLLSDDYIFLVAISISNYNYKESRVEKRKMLEELINNDDYDKCLSYLYIFDILDYCKDYSIIDALNIYNKELDETNDVKLSIDNACGHLSNDMFTLEIHNQKNYRQILYLICKYYYEYKKYLLYNKEYLDKQDIIIVKDMEKDLDLYINSIEEKIDDRWTIIKGFYDYVSLNKTQKNKVRKYIDKEKRMGHIKIFNNKKDS